MINSLKSKSVKIFSVLGLTWEINIQEPCSYYFICLMLSLWAILHTQLITVMFIYLELLIWSGKTNFSDHKFKEIQISYKTDKISIDFLLQAKSFATAIRLFELFVRTAKRLDIQWQALLSTCLILFWNLPISVFWSRWQSKYKKTWTFLRRSNIPSFKEESYRYKYQVNWNSDSF